ncbi:MAG: hypothetical protein E7165_01620 [Firmicutes bacterium]|nr:hypothetical protein [Bacillota bacterium]
MIENEDIKWAYMTLEEISKIEDVEQRYQYRNKYIWCLTRMINPLLAEIKNKNFEFTTKPETCRSMIKDIMDYYGYDRNKIVELIEEHKKKN